LAERERGSADGGKTIYTGKRRGLDSPPFLVTYRVGSHDGRSYWCMNTLIFNGIKKVS
jgi:hypothetical protein